MAIKDDIKVEAMLKKIVQQIGPKFMFYHVYSLVNVIIH